MRKNTEAVFKAWRSGRSARPCKSRSIWTDGARIISYNTEIARQNGAEIAINGHKYSVTTSCQQSNLQTLCRQSGLSFRVYHTDIDYMRAVNA